MRAFVLAVAGAVRTLGLLASFAAIVIAAWFLDDGFDGLDWVGVAVAFVPPAVLGFLWFALKELAELPDRLRRLPATARERRVDFERLSGQLREPGRRLVRLPLMLWRLRVLAGAARDLVTPHAPLLPFLSLPFLTLSAFAAGAAVGEIAIAVLLLLAAL